MSESKTSKTESPFNQGLVDCQDRMFALISVIIGPSQDAWDVLQDTNAAILMNADKYDTGTSLWPLFKAFAIRQALKHCHARKVDRLVFDPELLDSLAEIVADERGPASEEPSDEYLAALKPCMKKLSPVQRDLLKERYATKDRVDELAKRHSLSAASFSMLLYRIRAALRKCIERTIKRNQSLENKTSDGVEERSVDAHPAASAAKMPAQDKPCESAVEEKFARLLERFCDGTLSSEEFDTFNQLLLSSEALRIEYTSQVYLNAFLRCHERLLFQDAEKAKPAFRAVMRWGGIAAGLVLLFASGTFLARRHALPSAGFRRVPSSSADSRRLPSSVVVCRREEPATVFDCSRLQSKSAASLRETPPSPPPVTAAVAEAAPPPLSQQVVAEHPQHKETAMNMKSITKAITTNIAAVATAAATMSVTPADADTKIWTGTAGTGLWSDTGNWSDNVAPVNGDSVSFSVGAATVSNDLDNLSLANITVATTGACTFNGKPIALTGDMLVTAGGVTHFTMDIDISSSSVLTLSSKDVYFDGALTGSGSLLRDGTAAWYLKGGNTYSGTWTLTNGITHAASKTSFGQGGAITLVGQGNPTTTGLSFDTNAVYSNAITFANGYLHCFTFYVVKSGVVITNLGPWTINTPMRIVINGALALGGGGTVNQQFVLNTPNSGYLKIFDKVFNSPNQRFYFDSGTVYLETAYNYSDMLVAGGTLFPLKPNLLLSDKPLQIGTGYERYGTLNLCGNDQQVSSFASAATNTDTRVIVTSTKGPATLEILQSASAALIVCVDGEASLKMGGSGTLNLTNSTSQTTGALIATNGTILVDATASFPNLTGLVATNKGHIAVNSTVMNPLMENVTLADSGILQIGEGIALSANYVTANGAYLAAGTYGGTESGAENKLSFLSGKGSLRVLKTPLPEGGAFVWNGAGSDTALATAENWKEGTAPALLGGDTLVFSEGTDHAEAADDAKIKSIQIVTNAPFLLSSAEGKAITLYGGLTVSNTENAVIAHTVSADIVLGNGQIWDIESNATLNASGNIAGGFSDWNLVKTGTGRLTLSGNNSFESGILISNGAVHIASSQATGQGSLHLLNTSNYSGYNLTFGNNVTCSVPVIVNNNPGFLALAGANPTVTFDAPFIVTNAPGNTGGGNAVSRINGTFTFRGGIEGMGKYSVYFVIPYGKLVIEEKPFRTTNGFILDDSSGICYLNTTNNLTPVFDLYGPKLVCGFENAFPTNAVLYIGQPPHWNPKSQSGSMDLSGHNQSFRMIQSATLLPTSYVSIQSDSPAKVTLSGYTGATFFSGRFNGHAGLVYSNNAAMTFSYNASTTTGTLEVAAGTVAFTNNAGWVCATNLLVTGGTLQVQAGSADCAFGSAATGYNAYLHISNGGKVDIAPGVAETVNKLTINGKPVSSGTYGGTGSGAQHILPDTFINTGILRVRKSDVRGTVVMLM